MTSFCGSLSHFFRSASVKMAWFWEAGLWMTISVYLKNRQYDREMLLLVIDLKESQILFIFFRNNVDSSWFPKKSGQIFGTKQSFSEH